MSQPVLSHPCTTASVPLETVVAAAPDSKALGSSAPALPILNPRLADTLSHTDSRCGRCRAPPPPHTSTNRHIRQKRAGVRGRLQREEDQPCDSTNKPKINCSHYSATQKLVLLNAIFLMPEVKKKKSLL